jgi:hypothetical protein
VELFLPAEVPLGPVAPGRSALGAFQALEAAGKQAIEAARAEAEKTVAEGKAEADRIRADGEARLKQAVVEGQAEAVRDVEDRARDDVSRARRDVATWVAAAESAIDEAVRQAVDLLAPEGATASTVSSPDAPDEAR